MKQNIKTNEEKDTNDSSSTGDESEDGQSSISHKDQEEEDWVDYMKRSTNEAIEKMGNEKIWMLGQDSQ